MEEKIEYTKYEQARIIGARALQIAMGAPLLSKTEIMNPIQIAKKEFDDDVLPITVRRLKPAKRG